MEREERVRGKEPGAATGARCACETDGDGLRPCRCEKRGAQRRGWGMRASQSEADRDGLSRYRPTLASRIERPDTSKSVKVLADILEIRIQGEL